MASKTLVCTQCGYIGNSKTAIEGNGCIELILWLFFIIPGLIYSIWRSSSRHGICPKCGNKNLIPLDSPKAQKMVKEELSQEEVDKMTKKQEDEKKEENKNRKRMMIFLGIVIGFVLPIVILCELAY